MPKQLFLTVEAPVRRRWRSSCSFLSPLPFLDRSFFLAAPTTQYSCVKFRVPHLCICCVSSNLVTPTSALGSWLSARRTSIEYSAFRFIAVSLGRDPKMLARVMEEQQKVLDDPSAPLTWENLGEMELLHNCVREALRVNSPVVRAMATGNLNRKFVFCVRGTSMNEV